MHLSKILIAACTLVPMVFCQAVQPADRVFERAANATCTGAPIDGYHPPKIGWPPYQWGCHLKHRPKRPVFELIHYHDCQDCYQPADRFDELGGWEGHQDADSLCKPLPPGPLWPQRVRYTYHELKDGKASCQTMRLYDSKFTTGGGWIGDDDARFHKIIFQRVREYDKDGIEKEFSPRAWSCKVSVYELGNYDCQGEPVAVFGDEDDRKCLDVTGQNVKVECEVRNYGVINGPGPNGPDGP